MADRLLRPGLTLLVLALLFAMVPVVSGQTGAYVEDFQDGRADGWELQRGWRVVADGGNQALRGEGHSFAHFNGVDQVAGTIESLELRYKLPDGNAHVVFRQSGSLGRYFVRLEQSSIALHKTVQKIAAGKG